MNKVTDCKTDCLCKQCKHFIQCAKQDLFGCPGALCLFCNDGTYCVTECNVFKKNKKNFLTK